MNHYGNYLKLRQIKFTLILSLIAIVVSALGLSTGTGFVSTVQSQIVSSCWSISSNLSQGAVEPGGKLNLVLQVKTTSPTYDFHVDITSSPAVTLNGPQGGGSLTIGSLDSGNTTAAVFDIVVPKSLQNGQAVELTINVKSHNDPPGPFGFRAPWDNPECVATSRPGELKFNVISLPHVFLTNIAVPSQVDRGSEFTISLTVLNNGTGPTTPLKASIELPSALQLVNMTDNISGTSLIPGEQASGQWMIRALANGTFQVTVLVEGQNIQILRVNRAIIVNEPSQSFLSGNSTPALMIPQLVFVPRNISLLFIGGLILAGIAEWRRGHIGRVSMAVNVFMQWQIFFGYWTRLPVWFQWYLNFGTILAIVGLATYFLHRSIHGFHFYDITFYLFGSFAVLGSLIIGAALGVPLW